MPTFEFDDGTANVSKFDNTATTISITDAGVNFTWSVTSTDGQNTLAYVPDTGGGKLTATTFSGLDDVFTLAVTGPGNMTRFSGNTASPVVLNLTRANPGTWVVRFIGTTQPTVVKSFNTIGTVFAVGEFTHITFTATNGTVTNFFRINDISVASISCFLEGTRIATPEGEIAVEHLMAGDLLQTPGGGRTRVKWVGQQPIEPALLHPARINPIVIRAGALADGVPSRDLYVSADHALMIDGHLINAGALVNDHSIYQVARMPMSGFTYYHIETDAHEVILAEGVAAETFIDYAGSESFVNGDARGGAVIAEMNLPRISSARLVPEAIRARLDRRATATRVA